MRSSLSASGRLWWLTLVLLATAAGRALYLQLPLDNDEIWTVWQTFGSPGQIIQWTSPTETPLYFLILGGWRELAGFHPIILRWLALLLALPAAPSLYRAARRLYGPRAGVLAALAYSALAVSVFISLYTRGYVLAYTGLPLALWLATRYFDRPSLRRGLLLGVALAVVYAATVTAVPALALLALWSAVVYRTRVWRGWLPAAVALALVLPDILATKLGPVASHAAVGRGANLPALPGAAFAFFEFLSGAAPVWYILVALAALALVAGRRRAFGSGAGFWLGWTLLVPLLLYVLEPRLGFYAFQRYGWWYAFGVAVLAGAGLAELPRAGRWLAGAALVVAMFAPGDLSRFGYIVTPLGANLRWLVDHLHADDALLVDPNITCNFPEEWDYYTRLYFSDGLRVADTPDGVRRLWYVASLDEASRAMERELARTRAAGRFVGPPGCFFRLYEAPPDPRGIRFANGMRFHGAQVMAGDRPLTNPAGLAFREGEVVRLRLWWSADRPLPLDYSVVLFAQRGSAQTQSDSAPQVVYPLGASPETSRWEPGQIIIEEREIRLPAPAARGGMRIRLGVYWYGDVQRLPAPGTDSDNLLTILNAAIIAW